MAEWAPGLNISKTPIRKVIGRSSSVTNGWHRTAKNPFGFCSGESIGELEFLIFADMDPGITLIHPQPTKITLLHNGKPAHHIPDFAVIERGESIIYEVKSDRQYGRQELMARLACAAAAVEADGWQYYVVLKQDVLKDPRYRNVYDVWRRSRPAFDARQLMAVQSAVMSGERKIADVLTEVRRTNPSTTLETILSLAANSAVFIDFNAPIGLESLIRWPDTAALPPPLLPRRHPADDLLAQVGA